MPRDNGHASATRLPATPAIALASLIWLAAMACLFIAPVYDEVNAYNVVTRAASLPSLLYELWTTFPLYRPIGTSIIAIVVHALPFDLAWPLLRLGNCLMVLASLSLLLSAARRYRAAGLIPADTARVDALFWAVALLSPATMMVAAWYADIFDASCMLLIAAGIAACARGRWGVAGVCLGLSWFCKEAAIFAAPIGLFLFARLPEQRKPLYRAAAIYIALGALYWLMRSHAISLGSNADVHRMDIHTLPDTVLGIAMWLWSPGITWLPAVLGLAATLLVAATSRSAWFALLLAAMLAAGGVAYMGTIQGVMVDAHTPLIDMSVFNARFIYIPGLLLLFGLLLVGRRLPFLIAAAGFMFSLPLHYQRFYDFQQSFKQWYTLSASMPHGLDIHAPAAPGIWTKFDYKGLRIANAPAAHYELRVSDGRLTPRSPQP